MGYETGDLIDEMIRTSAANAACVSRAASKIHAMQSKITRIGAVFIDVLEWAEAQDEDLVPDWVEKLSAAVTGDR